MERERLTSHAGAQAPYAHRTGARRARGPWRQVKTGLLADFRQIVVDTRADRLSNRIRLRGTARHDRRAAIRSPRPGLVWRTGSPAQRHTQVHGGVPADWRSRYLRQWSSGSRLWPAL